MARSLQLSYSRIFRQYTRQKNANRKPQLLFFQLRFMHYTYKRESYKIRLLEKSY